MQIIIDGKLAALKKGTSFQFIAENRYFTGSDSYTLNITFPLRGCSQNLKIFGHIGRKDVSKEKITFSCEIRDKEVAHYGVITITELSPEEVKTQFLEGRSESNFSDTFDEVYINELNLGSPSETGTTQSPSSVWKTRDDGMSYVALPWINQSSGNIQNCADYNSESGSFAWSDTTVGLSFQPYLTYILKALASAIGYSMDITALEESYLRYLIICNTLPAAWNMPQFAKALPHWTITEFLEEIEKLLNGEFDINHQAKTITFAFSNDVIEEAEEVQITKVIDAYTTEISSDEAQCEYTESADIAYTDDDYWIWALYDCNWLIEYFEKNGYESTTGLGGSTSTGGRGNRAPAKSTTLIQIYDTFTALLADAMQYKDLNTESGSISARDKLLYARDIDTYFCFHTLSYDTDTYNNGLYYQYTFHLRLIPVNVFGKREYKKDNENSIELKMVPCLIDYSDSTYGELMCLSPGTTSEGSSSEPDLPVHTRGSNTMYIQGGPIRFGKEGEQEESVEYYSKIYVAFHDGTLRYGAGASTPSYLPRPTLDRVDIRADWSYCINNSRNLRLNDESDNAIRRSHYIINTYQKFTFSFLSDTVPNVRSLFFIEGKRYLCEKITSTFSEDGMSQLQKGTFYEVTEVAD